jgi:nitrilase
MGDASGSRVVDTPAGRIGSLICWESYMPLARYALYAQDIEIYVAPTWDPGENWIVTMRHVTGEAGCWVIGTATAMQGSDVPSDFPDRDRLFKPEEWINYGDVVVVKPTGAIAAGPLNRQKHILYAEIDKEAARRARRSLDVCGHYSRPRHFRVFRNPKVIPPGQLCGLNPRLPIVAQWQRRS